MYPQKAQQGLQELKVQQALKVPQVLQAPKGLRELKVEPALKVLQVTRDL